MRYIILSVSFLSLFFYSCGSDDNDVYIIPTPEPQSKKVVQHLSIQEIVGQDSQYNPVYETNTYEFTYSETGQVSKLTNTSDSSYSDFEYDGNGKITKILSYSDGDLDSSIDLYYSGDLLSYSTTTEDGSITQRDEYHYNTQNLLILEESCSNPSSCTGLSPVQYTYYSNNNLGSKADSDSNSKSVYLYDLKVNPFKEYNSYFKILTNNFLYFTLSNNNPLSENIYTGSSSTADRTIVYEITYDSDNYPITVVGKDAVTNRIWTSYTFDYQTITIKTE